MRTLVTGLAIGRVVIGAAMLLKPEEAVGGWIGRRAASYGGTQAITRAFGARDLSLGAGTLAGLAKGSARDWVIAGAFADGADFTATAIADDLPPAGRAFVLALAAGALALGVAYTAAASQS